MLKVIDFIHEHRNWRELLSNEPYYLKIKEDDELILLTYDQINSDFSQEICKECRGLIIDKEFLSPVALSFYKFFNFGEPYADRIDWKSAIVREKIDGSKILVFYYGGWRVATSGTLNAYKCEVDNSDITFGNIFDKALENNGLTFDSLCEKLNPDYCYTFELVSPKNRIVIEYKKEDIYLIGIRHSKLFHEIPIEEVDLSIKTPQKYELNNVRACIEVAKQFGYDKEGFVVQDKYYNRVKIKSPYYVAAHHLRLNGEVTEKSVYNVIKDGETSEFLSYFPEYTEIFNRVQKKIGDKKSYLLNAVKELYNKLQDDENVSGFDYSKVDKKQYAKYINENYLDISGVLFNFLKTDLFNLFVDAQWDKLSEEKRLNLLGL